MNGASLLLCKARTVNPAAEPTASHAATEAPAHPAVRSAAATYGAARLSLLILCGKDDQVVCGRGRHGKIAAGRFLSGGPHRLIQEPADVLDVATP
jgi:alpha-beta hydrolase superfamily lysophospholipase